MIWKINLIFFFFQPFLLLSLLACLACEEPWHTTARCMHLRIHHHNHQVRHDLHHGPEVCFNLYCYTQMICKRFQISQQIKEKLTHTANTDLCSKVKLSFSVQPFNLIFCIFSDTYPIVQVRNAVYKLLLNIIYRRMSWIKLV